MSEQPLSDKAGARATGRAARRRVEAGQRSRAAEQAAERFLALPETAAARAVLAYAATPEEIDPTPIVRALVARGVRVAYPRVAGPGALSLHWASPDDLEPGHRDIAEPPAERPVAAPRDIDLAIVPGVAFDAECCRIGHGGGFYDRLLPALRRDAVTMGLAFDEQVAASPLPREEHDVPVDIVVTPTRTMRRA